MRSQKHARTRLHGFTIVELLVALALVIFMMAILSEAFVTGLTAFRQLKAIGEMNERLRTTATVLRRDLRNPHFEGETRLRDISPGGMTMGFVQYGEGAFLAPPDANGNARPAIPEGTDSYGSPMARDADDWLMLSVRLRGNKPEEVFRGRLPGPPPNGPLSPLDAFGLYDSRFDLGADGSYTSQWAIVIYFLRRDPGLLTTATEGAVDQNTGAPLSGLPLYHLHRRQLLLVPEAHALGTTGTTGATQTQTPNLATAADLLLHQAGSDVWCYAASAAPPVGRFATPGDAQFPIGMKRVPGPGGNYQWDRGRRPSPSTNPPSPPLNTPPAFVSFPTTGDIDPSRLGADLLMTDVLSFDIQIWDPYADPRDPITGLPSPTGVPRPRFVDLGFGYYDPNPPAPATAGWQATPQALATRPFGRPPVRLDYPGIPPRPNPNGVPNAPHISQRIYNNAWVYDSWTRRIGGGPTTWDFHDQMVHQEPYPAGVQALKITIRIWDRKTNQTRQVTLIQDM